ncbi:hypothetical protein AWR27_21115 [Spirosoma montaniterrae]|uniref:FkbM family methyltransferase n=2 Tax=Spirosoma montaniterrae TaxID=1178516 RepID=A0A1P9X1W2_9BACT|nr:hypothetical protein AWR27_21115 [Spirosoma montaniterrae]
MIWGLLFDRKGYLHQSGWLRSVRRMQAIDVTDCPIPWLSYPFIEFIEPRLNKFMNVYEYGSGNSTRWFAKRVGLIHAIEHSLDWYNTIKGNLPDNAILVYEPLELKADYHDMAFMDVNDETPYSLNIKTRNLLYDIVIVDGVNRNNCIANSIGCVSSNGVIIVDNLEYSGQMQAGLNLLKDAGFKRLEFWGLSPIVYTKTGTGLFYRPDNCLLI